MRAVVQRVARACVTVDDRVTGAIGRGLLVLLGIAAEDTEADAQWLLDKLLDLRIFENEAGKFDRSVRDVNGELLVVSQFTLIRRHAQGPAAVVHRGGTARACRAALRALRGGARAPRDARRHAASSARTCRSSWSTTGR